MANKLPVKFYYNTMPGMPQITNQYGDTVAVLDCVLVNGTAFRDVASITFADGIATAELASHGFIIDMVIEISGAVQDEYNGEWRIISVTTDTFTFAPTIAPAVNAATGAIKCRIPPLGYEIVFSATNKRVYRSRNVLSTRPFVRVDNSLISGWNSAYSILSRITAAAQMTDIDTFVDGRMPYDPSAPNKNEVVEGTGTSAINGWFVWHQSLLGVGSPLSSGAGTAAAREWNIIGDDCTFYFCINPFSGAVTADFGLIHYGFGNYQSYKPADPYDYFMFATERRNPASSGLYPGYGISNSSANGIGSSYFEGMILPKSAFGYGDHTNFTLHHNGYRNPSPQISGIDSSIPYPNYPDFSTRLSARYICDVVRNDIRGKLPGQYFILQNLPVTHRAIINNVVIDGEGTSGSGNRKMLVLRSAYSSNSDKYILAYDITGPWR
jgi:hypothetical protein